jgi:ABC-type nitrate/sulfonate/bicarbonate transport system substrate-binding protein
MRRPFVFLVLSAFILAASPLFAQAKNVRFSVSSISIAEIPFKIAQVKGFYREEGLNVEVILIRGNVGFQALLGGSVDYTSAAGSTIAAAVRGIPVKLIFDESWMKGAIDFTQKSIGGEAKEVRPNQVFDFSFAEKAQR